jgi:hypothetical protein
MLIWDCRLAGFLIPVISSSYFIKSQLPTSYTTAPSKIVLDNIVASDATTTLLAWQLGNAYLLLGLLGVFILNTTSELKVVRAYLFALWLGDIGHVGFTLWAMGWKGTTDIGSWSAVVWGNIGATLFLFATRSLYFLDFFDGGAAEVIKEKTKRAAKKIEKKT